MAGCYTLLNDTPVTKQEARATIEKYDWSEIIGDSESPAEDLDILSFIMSTDVVCDLSTGKRSVRKMAELISVATGQVAPEVLDVRLGDVTATMGRFGVVVDTLNKTIKFATSNHGYLNQIMKHSYYEDSWQKVLRRHRYAVVSIEKNEMFAGMQHKYIEIPLDKMFDS